MARPRQLHAQIACAIVLAATCVIALTTTACRPLHSITLIMTQRHLGQHARKAKVNGCTVELVSFDAHTKTATIRTQPRGDTTSAVEGGYFPPGQAIRLDEVTETGVELSFFWCEHTP